MNAARRKRRAGSLFLNRQIVRRRMAGGTACDRRRAWQLVIFCDELVGDFLEAARGGILRFGDKIDGAEREGFERGVSAFLRMSAEKITGSGARPMIKRRVSIPSMRGISRSSVTTSGLKLFIFFRAKRAVHRGSDDFDQRNRAQELRGINFRMSAESSNDKDSNAFRHAIAPMDYCA